MLAAPDELLTTWERIASAPPVTRSIELLAGVNGWPRSDVATQSLGEHNRRLLETCWRLDGTPPNLIATCPSCATEVELEVPLAEMIASPMDLPGSVRLPIEDGEIELRPVTPADLEAALQAGDHDAARRSVLAACVSTHGGIELNDDELVTALAELDDGASLEFNIDCPDCAERWTAELDGGLLAWAALDRVAIDLLHQVEVLAARYGWREADILAMSATRRSFYMNGYMNGIATHGAADADLFDGRAG